MKLEEIKQLLTFACDYKTCSHRLTGELNKENTSIEQCAITSLIVNDFLVEKS